MTLDVLAQHEFANGDQIIAARDRRGTFCLVMDGPSGLETTIAFNRIEITGHTIELVQYTAEGRHVSAGSIEGTVETFGAVGEWLAEYAEEQGWVVA